MQVVIEWVYKSPRGKGTIFQSEELPAQDAVWIAEDLERTGRTKQVSFIDPRYDSSWTLKELKIRKISL